MTLLRGNWKEPSQLKKPFSHIDQNNCIFLSDWGSGSVGEGDRDWGKSNNKKKGKRSRGKNQKMDLHLAVSCFFIFCRFAVWIPRNDILNSIQVFGNYIGSWWYKGFQARFSKNKNVLIFSFFTIAEVNLKPSFIFRWSKSKNIIISSARHFKSCRFITVMRARLKVPAKNSPALLFLSRGKEEERKTTTISCFSPAEEEQSREILDRNFQMRAHDGNKAAGL